MSLQSISNTDAEMLLVKLVINAWIAQSKLATAFFDKYPDEIYLREVSPGRNRAVYLLGHLLAVSDNLLPLLGLGERLYPELDEIFLAAPDKMREDLPPVSTLKKYWKQIDGFLLEHFNRMEPADWLQKHNSVSDEDFTLNTTRNKLNVIINRTNHLAYHLGQLAFLEYREPGPATN